MNREIDYRKLMTDIGYWIRNAVSSASRSGVVVGLSGGIDSTVAAAIACSALGRENVLGLLMPCDSSRQDTEDGIAIAELLGVDFRITDISPVLDDFLRAGDLSGSSMLNVANIKSRLRMTMLYACSQDRLVLGTSNYSEILVGYWTKWGDGAADILPLGRLYKDEVVALAKVMKLPQWIVDRTPSAGLWPGQSDEEEMGVTYPEIRAYFQGSTVSETSGELIRRMVTASEHKRNPISYFNAREWMEENV